MIFVTGGTGMLGSYLMLELLKKGENIRASKRANSSFEITMKVLSQFSSEAKTLFSQIEWVNTDLFDQNSIEKDLSNISEIYHCAAQINSSSKNKTQQIYNNQKTTENLVNAALNQNIKKFCHVSSIAALGNSIDGKLISEETIWKEQKNNSTYSTSKYYSEMEVWRGIAEGLNAVIVNPSVILGMGDWGKGSANLYKKINDGLKFHTHGSSGFVDAKDVVDIMMLLMNTQESFGKSFIVSAENLNFKSLFEKIAGSLGKESPKIYATPFLTQIAWRLDWLKSKVSGKDPLITKESARTAHKILQYNNNKLLKLISFQYKSVDTTIQDIADIYNDSLEEETNINIKN